MPRANSRGTNGNEMLISAVSFQRIAIHNGDLCLAVHAQACECVFVREYVHAVWHKQNLIFLKQTVLLHQHKYTDLFLSSPPSTPGGLCDCIGHYFAIVTCQFPQAHAVCFLLMYCMPIRLFGDLQK